MAGPPLLGFEPTPPYLADPVVGRLPTEVERGYVDRAQLGDQEAIGLLYDAYLPRLYRYCLARVHNETDAEDLAEEIFVKVLGAIDGFEWKPVGPDQRIPFGAWLFRIAHNHVVSFHRRAATRGPVGELSEDIHDETRGPAELVEAKVTIEEVFAAVAELPEAQREVILLRFASGFSVAETAAALGKHETNVKVLQHKGVQGLKRRLAGDSDGTSGDQTDGSVSSANRRRGRER